MLHTLHKQPISVRKKIALAAILVAICALIIPLWLLETTQTLNIASKHNATKTKLSSDGNFTELQKQFSTAFIQYQELKNTIDNFKTAIQAQAEQTKLPALPNSK